jgi:hypothetical protein
VQFTQVVDILYSFCPLFAAFSQFSVVVGATAARRGA